MLSSFLPNTSNAERMIFYGSDLQGSFHSSSNDDLRKGTWSVWFVWLNFKIFSNMWSLSRFLLIRQKPFIWFDFAEPQHWVPMPRFVKNVARRMFPLIPAVTEIVPNVSILFRRHGLRLKYPNFYQSVTSTPFSPSLKNLTALFYKIRDFFILSWLNLQVIH